MNINRARARPQGVEKGHGHRPAHSKLKGKAPNRSLLQWPDHWAWKNLKGLAYCKDHHLHGRRPDSR